MATNVDLTDTTDTMSIEDAMNLADLTGGAVVITATGAAVVTQGEALSMIKAMITD